MTNKTKAQLQAELDDTNEAYDMLLSSYNKITLDRNRYRAINEHNQALAERLDEELVKYQSTLAYKINKLFSFNR